MDLDVAVRYADKVVRYCGSSDPFSWKISERATELPGNVEYMDILEYFRNRDCSFTRQGFHASKALEAWEFVKSGWVQEIRSKKTNTSWIVVAKVFYIFIINS